MDSYARGPLVPLLLEETLGDCLDRVAALAPDRDAVIDGNGRRLSFGELETSVDRAARRLLRLGIQKGTRVGLWCESGAEWLVCHFAAAKIGAVSVALGASLAPPELERACRSTQVRVVFTDASDAHQRPLAFAATLAADSLTAADEPVDDPLMESCRDLVNPRDAALILFTSGSEGAPKAVVHSHRSLVNGGFIVGEILRYAPGERACVPVPLHHMFGYAAGALAALTHGAAVIFPGGLFEAEATLRVLRDERCTSVVAVPAMFAALLSRTQEPLPALRTGVVAGARCAASVVQRIVADLHVPDLTIGFGMSEIAPVLFTAIDDPDEVRQTTTGRVQPHVECKVVEPGTDRVVSRGSVGELWARGYGAMLHYLDDPAATASTVVEGGWVRSGDLAVMRDDGCVSIVGRVKEIVLRAGEVIAPHEIEDVLCAHASVREAYVVGVPDDRYGEELCAWIRRAPENSVTAVELRRFCRARLAPHKIPRFVCFAHDWPLTASGKVHKGRLRDTAVRQLRSGSRNADVTTSFGEEA